MKAIIDRHAQRLTAAERDSIWTRVSMIRPHSRRAVMVRRLLPAMAAVVAVAGGVLVVSVMDRSLLGVNGRHMEQRPSPGGQPMRSPEFARRLNGEPAATPPPASAPPQTIDRLSERTLPSELETLREAGPAPTEVRPGVLTGRVVDAQNRPVPYANVVIKDARRGALSDENGQFRIEGLPPATYRLDVSSLGRERANLEVRIAGGKATNADVQMKDQTLALEEVEVRAEPRIDVKSLATKQSISAGPAAPGLAQPPVIPITGGTALPNDEPYDAMYFKGYGVNPFIATDEDALSTFAVDVDAASYTMARRYLELGHLPPPEAVRVEEFVNFFRQDYPRFESDDFRIMIDGAPSAFGPGYHLLRVGIKGREIADRNRKPARLAFVVDVSGSMQREDRLELVKRSLRLLVDRLREEDRVGIVAYGSEAFVVLRPTSVTGQLARATEDDDQGDVPAGRQRILDAIDRLHPMGSTNAEAGLRLGYDMARGMYAPGAINRVVLCSDGVANVGATGPQSILAEVRTQADRGIHLSTIGFGMGNYNDVLMEQLADRGDGNYYYVDHLDEARRVFVENLTGTLQTIAKDAKVQVEFDPKRVLRYRLLGFENRDVADRDFRNDRIDAGEIGAGHEVTALYEVKLAPRVTRGTIATVRFRYARPELEAAGTPQVREIERSFDAGSLARRFEAASPRFRLDAAVAEFAEILRGSYWAKEGVLTGVLGVARRAARDLNDPAAVDFVGEVERAIEIRKSMPDVNRPRP